MELIDPNWPALPSTYISGRLATEDDVRVGNAVFYQQEGATGPLELVIPQYGILLDESGTELPVFIVQAERSFRANIVGLRDFSGDEHVAALEEVRLLGSAVG
jgi:hypothetical protein